MLSQEELKSLLIYDPDTGLFHRRMTTSSRAMQGSIAGSKSSEGYLTVSLMRKVYKCHRLAWLYVYGKWPEKEIDHINHIRTDNRISNLRDVSKSLNQHNRKNSKGYTKCKNGWRAQMQIDGVHKHLGYFATKKEARSAYLQASRSPIVQQALKYRFLREGDFQVKWWMSLCGMGKEQFDQAIDEKMRSSR